MTLPKSKGSVQVIRPNFWGMNKLNSRDQSKGFWLGHIQTLISRCEALWNDAENIFEARLLQNDIKDTLFMAGPDFADVRREIAAMNFVRHESRNGLQPESFDQATRDALFGAVDPIEISRAWRFLLYSAQQIGPEGPPSAGGLQQPAIVERRGPKPRDHKAIAAVVRRCGPRWKSQLDAICEELDHIRTPIPALWKKQGHQSWDEALLFDRGNVIKSLENSLKQAEDS
jgi:hypothetical protein